MSSDDDWVKVALTDDVAVAELLFGLRRAADLHRPPPPSRTSPAFKFHWNVRQRRSRPLARHHVETKKKGEPTRASPTTPLSWSGATSVSGGAVDGLEESSKPLKPTGGARSKVSVRGEGTISKRTRKKKTLAELKEEETLLLKERKKLKSEIATMRLNIEKQRATSESLNRLKLDLESQPKMKTVTSSAASGEVDAACEHCSISPTFDDCNELNALVQPSVASNPLPCRVKELESEETGFSLPDLNLPVEGDFSCSEVLYGIIS